MNEDGDIKSFVALSAKQALKPFNYQPRPLGPTDVEVKITHCGICHSDIHLIDNDWGVSQYPLVPGHEIIGTITKVGSQVSNLKVGQRVGIGWECNSCGTCEWCKNQEENLCNLQEATCNGNYGGYAEKIRVNHRFAFPIPDKLNSENAAPLLCGGVTVYSPLKQYVTKSNMRVGIIGIGGLGHLALQFARAMGCEVTAFSTTPAKESEAKAFGAHHFVNINDQQAMEKQISQMDFLLSTVTANIDWGAFLNILRPKGKFCILGVPSASIPVPLFALIVARKSICGSNIGGTKEIKEMLEFAAQHNIKAKTETEKMENVNQALQRVKQNKVRYRMVLVNG